MKEIGAFEAKSKLGQLHRLGRGRGGSHHHPPRDHCVKVRRKQQRRLRDMRPSRQPRWCKPTGQIASGRSLGELKTVQDVRGIGSQVMPPPTSVSSGVCSWT
jgi:hypothetical protein